jgi:hypothetical protein
MTPRSDDIVAVGLRVLWELDALLAVGANRLDEISEADRSNLHAALLAVSAAITAIHPRRKHGEVG